MDAFSKEALSRLSLAEAVMRCWQFALDEEALQGIFDRYRGRSYEGALSFATIVHLTADALLEYRGSAHQPVKRWQEADALPASMEAVYGKLRRIPLGLSNGFLLAGTQRLSQLLPTRRSTLPKSLRSFTILFIDGKKIKRVPRMLKPARKVKAMVLGGKTIAALDWYSGLVVAINAHLDGEAGDTPLMPGLLAQVREVAEGPRLYVLDRQFCDLIQPELLTAEGDHFLIRYSAKVHFYRDSSRRIRRGVDERGNPYLEEWGWIGGSNDPRRCYVRRITLQRKAGKGEKPLEPIILITDLLDAEEFPAVDLLEAYLARWGIECVFQKITEVFHLQSLISTTPQGTVFQFAFCMLLYNLIQLLTQYLAASEKIEVQKISQENLFHDVHRQLIAWNELIGPALTIENLRPIADAKALREHLKVLLSDVWTDRWLKAPKKKRTSPSKALASVPGAHTSMYRLIHPSIPSRHRSRKRE